MPEIKNRTAIEQVVLEMLVSELKSTIQEVDGIQVPFAAQNPISTPPAQPIGQPSPKKKKVKVIFDKSTNPWEVEFSERGFLIGDTRLSFENIEDAVGKNYNIQLNGGKGIVLDAIKMQKILKYKNSF